MKLAIAAVLALVATGCPEPAANLCDDGLFCPPDTTCGGAGVCVVEEDACTMFPDQTPCRLDVGRGFCFAGACDVGVSVIGFTETFPLATVPRDVRVSAVDRPEILPSDTNSNGYFDIVAPRDTELVLQVDLEDNLPVRTRTIQVFEVEVLADFIYGGIPLVQRDVAAQVAETVGVVLDPARGFIVGLAFDLFLQSAQGGMTVATEGCEGPFYLGTVGPVIGATSTQQETGAFMFANCAPGTHVITAELDGIPCRTIDHDGPITTEVVPGTVSVLGRVIVQ